MEGKNASETYETYQSTVRRDGMPGMRYYALRRDEASGWERVLRAGMDVHKRVQTIRQGLTAKKIPSLESHPTGSGEKFPPIFYRIFRLNDS
jgi:hypothetical protein